MTIKNIAKMIPNRVRSEILLTPDDIIGNAVAVFDNENMQKLLKIWYKFIEPTGEITNCNICIGNILQNYRQMLPALIELENEYRKLEGI